MLIAPPINKPLGFTLIEMMIGISLGIFILGGFMYVFANTVATNSDTLKKIRLDQELRAIVGIITQDIRRAGYWSKAYCGIDKTKLSIFTVNTSCGGTTNQPNPFATITINDSKECILYRYDATPNGVLDTVSNKNNIADERFGFRLKEESVEIRSAGLGCDKGGWTDISDPRSVTISELIFDSTKSHFIDIPSNNGKLISRQIDITIAGHIKNDASIQMTLTTSIHVRNDRFCSSGSPCLGI